MHLLRFLLLCLSLTGLVFALVFKQDHMIAAEWAIVVALLIGDK